jgi:2-haloacid dehalogenase
MADLITGVRACVFDAYGTLFDVASAAAACEHPRLADAGTAFSALWREKQLQYTWLRAIQSRHADFEQVTADALDFTLQTLNISDAALRARLMQLYFRLKPYPEVQSVLALLKSAGMKLAILSNGSPPMLRAAVEGAGLGALFDLVLSVEEVGVYKPHPKVYQLAVDRLALEPAAICFQSSNAWDAYAASAFGMKVIWCNRQRQSAERLPGRPEAQITTLTELPALLGVRAA